jgi:hypothetical protein
MIGRRDRAGGQALVEFAIAVTVFLMLVMAIVDFGRAIYQFNGVAQAAREVARVTSVHPGSDFRTSTGLSTETQTVVGIQQGLVPALSAPTFECVGIDGGAVAGICTPGSWVRVTAIAPYTPVTPLLGLVGTWDISSSASMEIQ